MSFLSLSDTLHQLMHRYTHLLRTGIHQQGIALPITQIRTLKSIRHRPHSTAQSIAQHIQRDKAQITRALNALLSEKLIYKTTNPHDQRSTLLSLTTQGDEVIAKLEIAEAWAAEAITEQLDDEQLALFLQLSQRMLLPHAGTLAHDRTPLAAPTHQE
ncbi:MarR family winged helix-turn-helix transcriptional regulator [Psychrobacter aestuarii]|uniref:MarR family transcriptional regulator n=1 Tax=Psychrobacter aestuarii TaxID=556327 RepID=A0ABP3FDH1_9GAMM|nr:MarR family transcriptional regulator [Psychrobacter aestuarii]